MCRGRASALAMFEQKVRAGARPRCRDGLNAESMRGGSAGQQEPGGDQIVDAALDEGGVHGHDLCHRDAVHRDHDPLAIVRSPDDTAGLVPQLTNPDPFHEAHCSTWSTQPWGARSPDV